MTDLTEAFKILRQYEGLKLTSYQDSVGVWTIGYGSTMVNGAHVTPGMRCTMAEAESWLEADVNVRAAKLAEWIHVPVTGHMLSAIISLAYNIGMGAIYHSRMLADLNAGRDKQVVANDFMSWIHAGGHVVQGLINRRRQEVAIFLKA